MTADSSLLLRASDAPGVLQGWCGPVLVEREVRQIPTVLDGHWSMDGATVRLYHTPHGLYSPTDILLDASRPECADRIARWVAGRVGLAVGATAPVWGAARNLRQRERAGFGLWWLDGAVAFTAASTSGSQVVVPALASLDPADDRRLPDGSRWIDRAALVLVARHVGGADVAR